MSQAAVITQPGHPEIACEIRDFCLGGLFLKFTHPDTAIASLSQRADAEVEVVFTPAMPQATTSFRVPARLRRLSPQGVGVAFVRQPVEAMRALQKLRMAGHRQRLASLPAGAAHPHLRDTSSVLLSETLLQVHDQLMRQLGDKLHNAAAQASGIAEHSALLAAAHEFHSRATEIQTRFLQQVTEAQNDVRPARVPSTHGGDGGLALVDELDFEDWLATSSEAQKLEEQFREQLIDLEPRVGQVFGFVCDHSNNPFGPAVIGHAYRAAVRDVPASARAKQVAYGVLRDVLAEQLAPLYAELLALLPVADSGAYRPRPILAPERGTAPAGEPAATGEGAPVDAPRPLADPTGPSSPARSTLGRLTGSLLDFFRNPSAVPSLAGAPRAVGARLPGAADGVGPDVMDARGALAVAPAAPVLQRLASAGALPRNVTEEMQRSVDMFGALFDTMHTERSISESTRPFFQQLEASLIKLAMNDPQFLGSPAHPAHKVLNTLDRLSMVAGDDGKITDPRLLRLMNRWTERINAEADRNPGVFEEARTQLERVVKPLLSERGARIARLQEMCEGRQAAEVAKQRILRELLRRLEGRAVPNAVIELLNGGWRNVLLIAAMRHGVDSPEAQAPWRVLEQLCAWLDPAHDEAPAPAALQTLLQRIDEALTQVCADKFAQDRIVDQLAAALLDRGQAQHARTSVAARLTDADSEPLNETQDELAERLRVGDWLQFKSLDAPLNLIWIGDQPPVYVFANYRGIKKLDLKRSELLQALEDGDASWTEDLELPLMDRSYSAMIQKMQRDLLWQSSHDPATGLPNRKHFFRAIRRNWLRSKTPDRGHAIGVLRIDVVAPSGASASAEVGSSIVRASAHALPSCMPPGALLARAGESGLAFWIEADSPDDALAYARSLVEALTAQPQEINGTHYRVQAWAGVMWAGDCLAPETYYDNANAASARARESGVPALAYDSATADAGVLALAQWAHDLTDILAHNQLTLDCQPVVAATDVARTPLYHEILLHPATAGTRTIVTRDLIAVAERLQRVTEIDRWVVKNVMQWMRVHPEHVARLGGFSINLSGQSVTNPMFLKLLLADLSRGDVPGDKLIFEISEADAIDGHAQTQLFMRQLQRHGCRFTLDEFGGGASSYTRLKSMKLDYLKIDRALVRELGTSMIDEALVRSILETGSFLGIKTVAGFVEDEETLAKLREMGVDCVQGYLIAEPKPLERLA